MIRVDPIGSDPRIQPIFESHPIEKNAPAQPISSASSISQSTQENGSFLSLFRPTLAAPGEHYMLKIIHVFNQMEDLAKIESQNCEKDVQTALNRVQEIDRQKIEMLQKQAQNAQSKRYWSTLETVAQFVASTSAIVLGVGLTSVAPIAGGILIASGAIGLLNQGISGIQGWEWLVSKMTASFELQQKYAQRIDSCLTYLSTALSMVSTIGAYRAGAFALISKVGRRAVIKKAMEIATIANGILQYVARFGIARLDHRIMNINAQIKQQDAESEKARQAIPAITANLCSMIELSTKIGEMTKQAIQRT